MENADLIILAIVCLLIYFLPPFIAGHCELPTPLRGAGWVMNCPSPPVDARPEGPWRSRAARSGGRVVVPSAGHWIAALPAVARNDGESMTYVSCSSREPHRKRHHRLDLSWLVQTLVRSLTAVHSWPMTGSRR